jgi:hypothetical protein
VVPISSDYPIQVTVPVEEFEIVRIAPTVNELFIYREEEQGW